MDVWMSVQIPVMVAVHLDARAVLHHIQVGVNPTVRVDVQAYYNQ